MRSVLRLRPSPARAFSSSAGTGRAAGGGDTLGVVVFSSIVAGTFGLGCWQVQRYTWKVRVSAEEKERYLRAPSVLPSAQSQLDLQESVKQLRGCRVSTTGVFLHDKEVLLGPRSPPAGLIGDAAQGLATNPQGYYVITPLRRPDGTVIFVNRGWVAIKETTWKRPTGTVTVNAIASSGETKGSFSPVNNPTTKKLLWLESAVLLQAAGFVPGEHEPIVILEAVEPDNVPVTSYPASRRVNSLGEQYITPMTHLVYAFTWFSLCAAGSAMTFSKFFKKRRPRGVR